MTCWRTTRNERRSRVLDCDFRLGQSVTYVPGRYHLLLELRTFALWFVSAQPYAFKAIPDGAARLSTGRRRLAHRIIDLQP